VVKSHQGIHNRAKKALGATTQKNASIVGAANSNARPIHDEKVDKKGEKTFEHNLFINCW
jgi:hypothetical protein